MQKSNRLLLIRHSRDNQDYIDGNNDTTLTDEGIYMAQQMSQKIVQVYMHDHECKRVNVYSSNRKRALETAKILRETLSEQNIYNILHIDKGIRELRHGKIINVDTLSHQEKINGLEKAWNNFDSERFKGNIQFRFGEPLLSASNVLAPDFIDDPYGECQYELSYRINKSLKNIISNIKKRPDELFILVTHRGIVREIVNIIHSANEKKNFSQNPMNDMCGWEYCGITDMNINDVDYTTDQLIINQKSLNNAMKGDA